MVWKGHPLHATGERRRQEGETPDLALKRAAGDKVLFCGRQGQLILGSRGHSQKLGILFEGFWLLG